MSDPLRRSVTAVAAMLFGMGWIGLAAAQGYPNRPMTMIVPFPAGGATDTVARYLAEQMRSILGQSVIIENVAAPLEASALAVPSVRLPTATHSVSARRPRICLPVASTPFRSIC